MLVSRHRIGRHMPAVVHPGPDPAALAVCREVIAATSAAAVILNGSRARGNWDEQSDLDLIMVLEDVGEEEQTRAVAALERIKDRNYPGWRETPALSASLDEGQVIVSTQYYDARRRTVNHYIARAARDGSIFTREPGTEHRYRHDGDSSNEWDLVTLERLKTAAESSESLSQLHHLLDRIREERPWGRHWMRSAGRSAQSMLWDSGAALLSILGVVYPTRSVEEMARLIPEHDDAWAHRFRTNLGQLDQYAECGCEVVVTDPLQDSPELWESLERDRDALWQRILALSGYDLRGETSSPAGEP